MSRQITATPDQIAEILKDTSLTKEEFLHRLTQVKSEDYDKRN